MKKILPAIAGLFGLLFVSCASNSFGSLCEFPLINSGDLSSGRYIVMGEVSASNSLSMSNEEYSKLIKNEFAYDPQNISVKFDNDTANYGFVGKPVNIKMNVFERSAALAEYELIQDAKFNEADALACFKSETTISSEHNRTTVTTTVSALAVQVKEDSGYSIKARPVSVEPEAPEVTETEAPADVEAEADSDEIEE